MNKHDAACLRRKEDPAMLYVCTCGLADEQVKRLAKVPERQALSDRRARGALQAAHESLADYPAIVAMHEEQTERAEAEVVRLRAENERLSDEENNAGAECSRLEADMRDLHDKLTDMGLDGSINADSVGERIDRLRDENERLRFLLDDEKEMRDRNLAERDRLRADAEHFKQEARVLRRALVLACDDAWTDGEHTAKRYREQALAELAGASDEERR